ncbi:MAG: hypothetical protein ACU0GG_21420 [Paracoccaceae bacterium]
MLQLILNFFGLLGGALILGAAIDRCIKRVDDRLSASESTQIEVLRLCYEVVFIDFLRVARRQEFFIRSVQLSISFSFLVLLFQSLIHFDPQNEYSIFWKNLFSAPIFLFALMLGNAVVDYLSYMQTSILVSLMSERAKTRNSEDINFLRKRHLVRSYFIVFCDIVASVKIFTLTMPLFISLAIIASLYLLESDDERVEVEVISSSVVLDGIKSLGADLVLQNYSGEKNVFSVSYSFVPDRLQHDFPMAIILGESEYFVISEEEYAFNERNFENYSAIQPERFKNSYEGFLTKVSIAQKTPDVNFSELYQSIYLNLDALEDFFAFILNEEVVFISVHRFMGLYNVNQTSTMQNQVVKFDDESEEEFVSVVERIPNTELLESQNTIGFLSAEVPYSAFFISTMMASTLFYGSVIFLSLRRRFGAMFGIWSPFFDWPATSTLIVLSAILSLAGLSSTF